MKFFNQTARNRRKGKTATGAYEPGDRWQTSEHNRNDMRSGLQPAHLLILR